MARFIGKWCRYLKVWHKTLQTTYNTLCWKQINDSVIKVIIIMTGLELISGNIFNLTGTLKFIINFIIKENSQTGF